MFFRTEFIRLLIVYTVMTEWGDSRMYESSECVTRFVVLSRVRSAVVAGWWVSVTVRANSSSSCPEVVIRIDVPLQLATTPSFQAVSLWRDNDGRPDLYSFQFHRQVNSHSLSIRIQESVPTREANKSDYPKSHVRQQFPSFALLWCGAWDSSALSFCDYPFTSDDT